MLYLTRLDVVYETLFARSCPRLHQRAFVCPGLTVQLVGKFMENHVLTVVVVVSSATHIIPGENHGTPVPGLPQTALNAFSHNAAGIIL